MRLIDQQRKEQMTKQAELKRALDENAKVQAELDAAHEEARLAAMPSVPSGLYMDTGGGGAEEESYVDITEGMLTLTPIP